MTGLATRTQRPNLHYDIVNPETGIAYPPLEARGWAFEPKRMKQLIDDGRILWPEKPSGRPRLKRFRNDLKSDFTGFSTVREVGYTTDGTRELEALFGESVFDFPKPVKVIKTLCEQVTEDGDIVLDFFAGSGTTGQAVAELNDDCGGVRRFILVQFPELISTGKYPSVSALARERLRRVKTRVSRQHNRLLLLIGDSVLTSSRRLISKRGTPIIN